MGAAFPLTAPAWAAGVTPSTRAAIYYLSTAAPSFTLSKSGATAYQVLDYTGTVVSSGAVSGTTVTPAAPAGGWKCGWYRLRTTGPNTDTFFGNAYGSSMFIIIRDNANFIPNPARGTTNSHTGSFVVSDDITRGVAAYGPQRWNIGDAANYSSGTNDTGNLPTLTDPTTGIVVSKTYYSASGYLDSNRPRPLFVAFPNGGVDGYTNGALVVTCKDETIDGSQVFITVTAGSVSGSKIQVSFPNSGTVVETRDNLASPTAAAAALANSAYVRGYTPVGSVALSNQVATAIGNAKWNGVKATVTAVYPDVTWFEGPSNEPPMNYDPAYLTQLCRLFAGAVKAGNASAKVLGPSFVSANIGTTVPDGQWDAFFRAGAGAYLDGISFHAYNMELGDLNAARANLTAFKTMLTRNGQGAKPIWQTEQGTFTPVYGVYHPRRARWQIMQLIVQESFGIPKEQNHIWYDTSHGFWSQPTWSVNGDGTCNPQVALVRTFSEEVFGKNYSSALDFGTVGNAMYFGGIWRNPTDDTRCAVLLAASAGLGNVTLTTSATGTLTYSDAWGNLSTATVTNGKVTIPVGEIPTYLRLPAGATASVYQISSWAPVGTAEGNWTRTAAFVTDSNASDGLYPIGSQYDSNGSPYQGAVPGTFTIQFPTAQRFDRVVIFSGSAWQNLGTPTDFDVQTSPDGTTWTTRATVTDTLTATNFGSDDQGPGCQWETFWDERYIFDVALPSVVTATYVRLNVRAASYGGEPTAACVTAGGQGNATPTLTIQEIAVRCDDQGVNKRWVLNH